MWRLLNSAPRSASKQRVMVGYLARIAPSSSSEPSPREAPPQGASQQVASRYPRPSARGLALGAPRPPRLVSVLSRLAPAHKFGYCRLFHSSLVLSDVMSL